MTNRGLPVEGRGRPTKLTPAVQALVVSAIQGGNTRDVAASYAGIRRATLFEWLARGRAAQTGLFRDFADAIEKAEADAVVTSVGLIRRAAQTSWQAAAWWLERRYPDEWGRKDRVAIERLVETEADHMARELGLDRDEILASVERLLSRSR